MSLLASFDWQFIWDHLPDFWEGLKATLKVSAIGIFGSLAIGIMLGAARAHRIPVLSWLAAIYVEVIRNTPILVQILFLALALPHIPGHPVLLEPFTIAWLSVTIWGGAYNTENFRAGFEAVPYRYREAGLALGFSRFKTFLNVTLPIGGRIALPSSINTYISVLKNTSLLNGDRFRRAHEHGVHVRERLVQGDRDLLHARRDLPARRLVAVGFDPPARSRGSGFRRLAEMPSWVQPVADYMFHEGLRATLLIAFFAVLLSTIVGMFLGTLMTIHFRPLQALIRLYIEVWRGLPILVTIFIIYYALPTTPIVQIQFGVIQGP